MTKLRSGAWSTESRSSVIPTTWTSSWDSDLQAGVWVESSFETEPDCELSWRCAQFAPKYPRQVATAHSGTSGQLGH